MSYIGRQNLGGAYRQLDDISSGFDGSDTTHTMQVNSQNVTVGDVNQIILSLGGVIQKPGTDFTVSGSTLTFTTAPASGLSFFAILLGSDNGGTVTPTDGSVTASKLASDIAITTSGDVSFDGGDFVFNDSSADKDFRIESNGNANMFIVDGGNDAVSINAAHSGSYPDSGSDGLQVHASQLAVSNYSAGASPATINLIKSRGTTAGAAAGTAINQNDVVGQIVAYGDDSNSFEVAGKLQFMAGENWANGDCAGQFELYLTPDGSTTTDLKLRMLNDGRMGVGVYPEASGDARGLPVSGRLHATEDIAGYQCVYATTTAGSGNIYGVHVQHHGQDPDNNTSRFYSGGAAAGNRFIVYSDGDVVNDDNSYGAISDERIKQDIVDCNDQWDDIKALKIRNYKKKDDIEKYGDKAWVQLGVIAQELEAAGMDKCVKQESLYDDTDSEVIQGKANAGDIKEYKSVKYSILYMKAIKALQEAQTRIETLEADVKTLKGE
jgi:hypothetical protein